MEAPSDRALLDELLREAGCAALLVLSRSATDPDIARFARGAHLGRCLAVWPAGSTPRLGYWTPMEREEAGRTGFELLTPEALEVAHFASEYPEPSRLLAAVAARALALCGLEPGPVAIAGHAPAGDVVEACLRLAEQGWSFRSGSSISRRMRQQKTEWEIAEARRATRATCDAMRRVAAMLAGSVARLGELWFQGERLAVGRIRAEVGAVFSRAGLEQPEGNLIAPGEEGAVPHNAGTAERVLRPGETLIVDLFPKGLLFADCTRTFCVGVPPAAVLEGHAVVREALALARREAKPGRRGWDLQEAVCVLISLHGYPTPVTDPGTLRGYVHGLGHGVGYELHEFPTMAKQAGSEGLLQVGDLVTLEPGLYEPGDPDSGFGWAIRLEDHVLINDHGNENLTPLPYDLDPRAWTG